MKAATAALLFVLALVVLTAQEASKVLARLQGLGLESLPGEVTAYYSAGARARAALLQKRLGDALTDYDDRLGVRPTFALAVLNEAHWKQVGDLPYGVPWVSRAPYVAFFPSDLTRTVIVMGWQAGAGRAAPVSAKGLEAAAVSIDEAPSRLNDLIGYHEVGHAVILGIRTSTDAELV